MAASKDDKNLDTSQLEADINQLKADLKRLNDTLVGLGKDGLDLVQTEGAAHLKAFRKEADQMGRRIKDAGQSQYESLEAQVQERPLMALLAAFGLGLIVSRFLDRR